MSYNHKISDLLYQINSLVPKNICDYFINFYENNSNYSDFESSYKHQTKKMELDNYKSLHLSKLSTKNEKFIQPLEIAKIYINIMITNYVLNIQKNICPTFDNLNMKNSFYIRILKYEKGQCIKDHTDVESNIRASCTLNLNEDYEGGEFRFFDGQVKKSFKTGDGIIFPAEPIWIHGTEPITKGTRYSINCFLQY